MKNRYYSIGLTLVFSALSSLTIAQQTRTGNSGLDSLISQQNNAAIQLKLKTLGKGDEKAMMAVYNYYIYKAVQKDSVAALIVRRFPKGDFAFYQQQRDMYKQEDARQREQLLLKLKADFPERNYDDAYHAVSNAFAKANNAAKAKEYLAKIKNENTRESATAADAQEIAKTNAATAEAILQPEILRLKDKMATDSTKVKGRYRELAGMYGAIMIQEKKYDQASEYISYAYENAVHRDLRLTGNYGLVMSKTAHHTAALAVLTPLVNTGKTDAAIKAAFADSYTKVYPDSSARIYLQNVENRLLAKTTVEVAKNEINEPAPNFEITDADNKRVSLKDFAGKTIILDFWATWCGPCKASFPAMQRVVDHYKNDANVKFLFIHTLETEANPLPAAKSYLSANHYRFNLYIDLKDPQTKKNKAFAAFGGTGIPAKYIIDDKGFIRFKTLGFSGSDDDTVRELIAMITTCSKHL